MRACSGRMPAPAAIETSGLRMLRAMDGPPQITITFPGTPEFLRLARLTSADAGSRAGFDYEDIDDLRIAVSELCTLISGGPAGTITLSSSRGEASSTVRGQRHPGSARRERVLAHDRGRSRGGPRAGGSDDGATAFRLHEAARARPTCDVRRRNDGDAGRSPRRLSVCREGPARSVEYPGIRRSKHCDPKFFSRFVTGRSKWPCRYKCHRCCSGAAPPPVRRRVWARSARRRGPRPRPGTRRRGRPRPHGPGRTRAASNDSTPRTRTRRPGSAAT